MEELRYCVAQGVMDKSGNGSTYLMKSFITKEEAIEYAKEISTQTKNWVCKHSDDVLTTVVADLEDDIESDYVAVFEHSFNEA